MQFPCLRSFAIYVVALKKSQFSTKSSSFIHFTTKGIGTKLAPVSADGTTVVRPLLWPLFSRNVPHEFVSVSRLTTAAAEEELRIGRRLTSVCCYWKAVVIVVVVVVLIEVSGKKCLSVRLCSRGPTSPRAQPSPSPPTSFFFSIVLLVD